MPRPVRTVSRALTTRLVLGSACSTLWLSSVFVVVACSHDPSDPIGAGIDECTDGTAACDPNATCIDSTSSYECVCNPGYDGDGQSCADVDECAGMSPGCGEHATCTNEPGSYACTCQSGFTGDGTVCDDVDECADGTDDCPDDATCSNTVGSFACVCDLFEGSVSCGLPHMSTSQRSGCFLPSNGTLWCWGSSEIVPSVPPVQVGSSTSWRSVGLGRGHACALQQDGSLWCWGDNNRGQLGSGSNTYEPTPVRIGSASWMAVSAGGLHTCGIQSNGSLWCWGLDDYGQLGDGTANGFPDTLTPVQVGSSTGWTALSAGEFHTCGIQSGGTLWCWGGNPYGQIGDGSTVDVWSPTQIGSSTSWTNVSAGSGDGSVGARAHTCGRQDDGTLWCWGLNDRGQLGDGTTTDRWLPTQIGATATWSGVSTGGFHSCGLRSDGTLWCWGANESGQLGNGMTMDSPTPVPVSSAASWGVGSAAYGHSCGVQIDGSPWCWGLNGSGQLGDGLMMDSPTPVQVDVGSI